MNRVAMLLTAMCEEKVVDRRKTYVPYVRKIFELLGGSDGLLSKLVYRETFYEIAGLEETPTPGPLSATVRIL